MNEVRVAEVLDLDYRGRGVVRDGGRVVFVAGALPGERVRYRLTREKKRFAEGIVSDVLTASPQRVEALCPYYTRCGGCDLQHMGLQGQREWKMRWWTGQLARHGGGAPEDIWPLLGGEGWHYRRRARLAVSAGNLGFRARADHAVVDIARCLVLDERLNALLPALREVLPLLPAVDEITLDAGDDEVAIGFASRNTLPAKARRRLQALAQAGNAALWWGREQLAGNTLHYALPDFALDIAYTPWDFTQANADLNRAMVAQAIAKLAPQSGERIADFFAGLGNFSLPLARAGAEVVAVEGVDAMVAQTQALAAQYGLAVEAVRSDLFAMTAKNLKRLGIFQAWLLDPPRAGAQALIGALPRQGKPARILYVSCDAATFVRDAALLRAQGYRMAGGGVVDMFAQTAHLESMALFTR